MNFDLQLDDPIYNDETSMFESSITYTKNNKTPEITTDVLKYISCSTIDKDHVELTVEFLPSCNNFYTFFNELEEDIKMLVLNSSESLIGIKMSNGAINNLFKKSVKLPETLPSLPRLKFKVNKNMINKDNIEIGTEITITYNIKSIELGVYDCRIIYDVTNINFNGKHCQSFDYLFTD